MTASVPIYNHLVKLAAVTFLATSAFSQALPKYDPATEATVKGIVQEVRLVPPSGGKPVAYLVMKSGTAPTPFRFFSVPRNFSTTWASNSKPKTDRSHRLQGQTRRRRPDPRPRSRQRRRDPHPPLQRRQARLVGGGTFGLPPICHPE